MGVVPWVDRGTFPLLFEVEGTPCVFSPYFSGVDIFCTNAHGIRWMIGAIFVKFSQLILMKTIKIVATRCQILRLKCTKFNFKKRLIWPWKRLTKRQIIRRSDKARLGRRALLQSKIPVTMNPIFPNKILICHRFWRVTKCSQGAYQDDGQVFPVQSAGE